MKAIMAFTWFLVFIVVKLFSESTCTSPVKPVCEDLSLQYAFFLVPPSNELENLMKFLGNIESATIFETPENDGMVQVICDPKDWEEIYRYTKDQGINFLELTYCIENSELPALQELRLRRKKLRKFMINEALDNILEIDTGQGKNVAGEKESNGGVSRVLKNGRIIKTSRAVHYAMKKNVGKNRLMRTTKKDDIRTPSMTSLREKSKSRRSVDTETAGSSWIRNTLRRIKRYSWDILTKNYNYENGRGGDDVVLNRRKARCRTMPSWEEDTLSMPDQKKDASDGESTATSPGESDSTESTGTTADSNTTTEVISETTTYTTKESAEEIMQAEEDSKDSKNRGSRDKGSGFKVEIDRERVAHRHGTTEEFSDESKTIENRPDESGIKKSRRDNDHSKTDDFYYVTIAPSSYAELAGHIYHVFEWVKDLESRGKMG